MNLFVFPIVSDIRNYHDFLYQIFLSHIAESFHCGVLQCFISFGYRERLGMSEGGRESCFSFQIVLSHSTDMFRREPFSVSLLLLPKKFVLRRVMSQFPVKFFWLAVPENFIGEPYFTFFRNVLAAKKFTDNRGVKGKEGVSRLSFKHFWPTLPKNFVEETIVCHYFWVSKKKYA